MDLIVIGGVLEPSCLNARSGGLLSARRTLMTHIEKLSTGASRCTSLRMFSWVQKPKILSEGEHKTLCQ
jgi:hypothetical protein